MTDDERDYYARKSISVDAAAVCLIGIMAAIVVGSVRILLC